MSKRISSSPRRSVDTAGNAQQAEQKQQPQKQQASKTSPQKPQPPKDSFEAAQGKSRFQRPQLQRPNRPAPSPPRPKLQRPNYPPPSPPQAQPQHPNRPASTPKIIDQDGTEIKEEKGNIVFKFADPSFDLGSIQLGNVIKFNIDPDPGPKASNEVPVNDKILGKYVRDDDSIFQSWKTELTGKGVEVIEGNNASLPDDHGRTDLIHDRVTTMINKGTARNIDLKHEGRHVDQWLQAIKKGDVYVNFLKTPVGRAFMEVDAYKHEKKLSENLGDQYKAFLKERIGTYRNKSTGETSPLNEATPAQEQLMSDFWT